MQAFHSMWTAPFLGRQKEEFYIEDFELLTTILSALKWREFNGDIKMVTDKIGAQYYRKLGLEFLWNLGIDESLEKIPKAINPEVFWAAGKLFALRFEQAPIVMIDTDFIVWQSIKELINSNNIYVIHREELMRDVYPPASNFEMDSTYKDFDKWNWIVRPCNTAFLYLEDMDFKQYYIDSAFNFMLSAKGANPLTYMVFAEQRLISMCALEKGKKISAMSSVKQLFSNKQKLFTHIWGHKRHLRANEVSRAEFCKKCMRRIYQDYPDLYEKIRCIPSLKLYDENIMCEAM